MITEKIGECVRELRKETGLSQEKFAAKIGMDRPYYRIQSNNRNSTNDFMGS